MLSEPLQNLFPHPQVRAGQKEFLLDLHLTFSQQKILIAHAPTGLGKTASALTVALHHALEHEKRILFLTNRHTQHQIAINTLKQMKEKTGKEIACVDLIGKRWMCNQEVKGLFGNEFTEYCKTVVEKGECEFYNMVYRKKEATVEARRAVAELERLGPLHNEEVIAFTQEQRLCSYEVSLLLAKKAKIIIGDYYYLFNPHVQDAIFTKLGINTEDLIVIVDEGHNLPTRVTEMLSYALTSIMIKNAVLEAKRYHYDGMLHWLQDLMRILSRMAEFPYSEFGKEKVVIKDEFVNQVNQILDYDNLIAELELAADEIRKKQHKSYLGGISTFLQAWKGSEEGFTRIISERTSKYGEIISLNYVCLDPSIITKDLFSRIHAGVIMSGTLKPTFMYKDVLGIERGIEKEYDSPFPRENKLSIIIPETSTKYTARGDTMYRQIAQKCSEICSLIPGNVALFFPSYDVRDKVGNFILTPKKKSWEKSEMSKEEKEVFLNQFRAEKEKGGVLLGVSGANFAEGIDLPGDLLNGVVVIGLPLAKPNLHTKEVIKYYEQKFGRGWDYGYIYPAMNKCLQSAGRCIRSETDKGTTIYLDERFAWQRYFCCFPKEGLRVSKEYGRLLKEFFGKS